MKLQDRLLQQMNEGNFISTISDANTHVNRHVNKSKTDTLNRIFDDKFINSAFDPDADIEMLIEEALLYQAQNIQDWMNKSNMYDMTEFVTNMPEDDYGPIGTGIIKDSHTNLIKEYKTNALCIVLKKEPCSKFGFTVRTAYPDMRNNTLEQTDTKLHDYVKETDLYQNSDIIGKAYMEYRTNPKSKCDVSYKPGIKQDYKTKKPILDATGHTIPEPSDSIISIGMRDDRNPDTWNIVCIKENKYYMYTIDKSGDTPIKLTDTPYTRKRDEITNGKDIGKPFIHLQGKWNLEVKQTIYQDYPDLIKAADKIRKTIYRLKSDNIPQAKQLQLQAPSPKSFDNNAKPYTDDNQNVYDKRRRQAETMMKKCRSNQTADIGMSY